MPGGVAMASTSAAAAPAVEPPPDDLQAVESKIERLTRSVAALKKRTIEEMNSLKVKELFAIVIVIVSFQPTGVVV